LLVVLVVLLASGGLRRDLTTTFEGELARHLALGDRIVRSAGSADPDSLVRDITRRIGYRVTLIETDGVVIGESYLDPGQLRTVENHRDRPEVRAVLAGNEPVSFAERTSATVNRPLLYAARLTRLDGSPVVLRIAAPLTEIDRAVGRVRRTVAATGFLAMLLAMAAAYALSVLLSRPLVALADRTRRLATGDLDTRVPRSRIHELNDVGAAFNRLTEELKARLSELGQERDEMKTLIDCMAEGVIALTDDARVLRVNRSARSLLDLPDLAPFAPIGSVIREPRLREALEASVLGPSQSCEVEIGGHHILLSSASLDQGGAVTTLLDITELRRLERVRSDFVANASHELRTPLTAIRGFAETLVDGDPPEELRREFLASIEKNTLRLQRLVDDLLDLSRFESGGWVAGAEEFSASEAVGDAWDQVAPAAEAAQVDLEVRGDARVRADRQGLVNVFRNLMENAVRHSDREGRVRVVIRSDERTATLEVADDGEGIPARALPRIFERFYRADSSRARDFGGTGLGLSIVRHLVVAMGGEVEAESELGKGTTIRFTLPKA
jgi:two-component system, OmpR family, phosphate regulon sensor histidine kinase PhoR